MRIAPARGLAHAGGATLLPVCLDRPLKRAHQINHDLVIAQVLKQLFADGAIGAEHHNLRAAKNFVHIVGKQRADVGYDLVNESAVGANQAPKRNILVPDADLAAFANQVLDQVNHGAFAQIVGAGFETQAKDGDIQRDQYEGYQLVKLRP